MSTVSIAMQFAEQAHQGQVRKYTGVPYILHPAEVVGILRAFGADNVQLAAAWLHDVVEDTPVELDRITNLFGDQVSSYVWLLTNTETGNRATRRALERERLRYAPGDVQTIKYADLISNTHDIVAHDMDFAVQYLKEKEALLNEMRRGDPRLRKLAWDTLHQAEAFLP